MRTNSRTVWIKRLGRTAKHSISVLLSAVLLFQPVLANAQSVTASTSASTNNRPGIGSTPNGVPLVDIVTPNARGLSHNKYDQFNVGKPGLILNNFNGEVGTSRLGGVTPGNANLKNSGPASVILNEVTSGNRSQLLGPTEVFGGRADVVIANPNGITCDGCGFINTPRATLSTGTPDVGADGRLNGLTVRGGDVTIGAKGANFSAGHAAVDLFDIVSRSVRIDGPLYAKDLRLTAGRNKFAYDTGEATPLEATSGTPEFAIDGSALGAMQADRIKIVVTEKGAGVRMRGDMAANVGELSLSADGKISIGNASGASGVNLNSKARIEARKVTSKKKFVAKAQKGIVLETVAADGNVEIAGGAGLLSVAGDVTSLGAVVLSSAGNLSLGSVEAGGPVSARSSAGNIAVWGIAKSAGDVTLDAASGSISAGSLVSFRNLSLQAGLDIGIPNDLLAQGNVTARARSIRSNVIASGVDIDASAARSDGETVLGDAGDLKLTASAGIEAATLLSAGNLSVSASSLKSDTVTSHRSIGISGDVDVSGQVLGAGDVLIEGRSIAADTVASGVLLHSAGGDGDIVLGTAGALTLGAKGGSVDVRSLSSARRLVVEAASVEAASVTAHEGVALSGDLTVTGQVLGGGDIVASGRRIAVKALVSGVDFARTTAGAPVVLRDRGDITINAASGSVEADMLLSAGSLKATAAALTADSITSHEDLDIAGTVAVSGTVLGARNVSIDGGAISADSIATKSGDLALIARNGAVDVDALESAGQITVDAPRLEARTVTGRGDVRIDGNVTIAEQLIAERNITLASRDLSIETLIAGLDFDRTAASGGKAVLAGEGGITIDAASGSLRMATLLSAGDVSATVGKLDASNVSGHGNISIAGDVNVGGQILGARNVAISGNALRAGAIASGVDFAATAAAGGSLVLGQEGDLRLSARGGTVAADILTSAGHLGVDASRLDSQSIEGHGDIRIAGNTTVRGRLLGAGDIDIAGQSLSIETLVAGVDFEATKRSASGDIVLGSDGTLTLTANSGTVTTGTLLSAGDLGVTASRLTATNITGRKNVRLSGEVDASQILGGRDIAITGNRVTAGSIAAGIDFAKTQASGNAAIILSDSGSLTIDAASGSVETGTVLTASAFNSISSTFSGRNVTSHGAVTIEGATAIDGSLLGKGDVTIRGNSIRAGAIVSGVDFGATKRSASGDIVLGGEGALTLTASSGNVSAGTLLSASDLAVTAKKTITTNITGRKEIRLSGELDAGQILGAQDIMITGPKVGASSIASGVDFAATEASTNGAIALSDHGTLTITAGSGNVEVGTVLTAGAFTSSSGMFTGKSVTSHGAVSIEGSTTISGSLLGKGDVTIRGGAVQAGAIASGVDFATTERSASGNVVLGGHGTLTLTATSGNVSVGTLLSASDFSAQARKIVATNITVRRGIQLSGETEVGQVLGGRNIVIAGNGVKAGSIASGVDFAATEASDNGAIVLSDSGALTIKAVSGSVEAGTVLTASAFNSISSTFSGKAVTSHGAVSIEGATTIDGSLLGQGDVTIRGGNVSAGAIVSGVDFAATKRSSSGSIVLGTDGALTLTATSGDVMAGTLMSAGDLSATGSKFIASNITGRKDIRLSGEVDASQVLGGGDIAITGNRLKASSIASGVDFVTTEAGNGSIALADRGDLTIDAASGSVEAGTILTAGKFASRSGTFAAIGVTAHGAVSIKGSTAIDGSLLGHGNVTVRGDSVSAGAIVSGVDFAATKHSPSGSIALGADGALTLHAGSGNVTAGALLSAGGLSVAAKKVAVSNITGRKAVALTGELATNQLLGGGDITIVGARLKAGSIASGVDFAATEAGNGAIALTGRGNLTIDAASGSVDAGTVLTAGSFTNESATFAAKNITAHGVVSIDGSTAIDGSLLGQGDVTIRGGSISAGAIVSGVDFAATKQSSSGNIVLGADGTLTLNASAGNVTAGTLLSAGDLAATASKITVSNITGRKSIGLTGEVETNQVLGGGDITVAGAGVKANSIVSGVDFAATEAGNGAIALAGRGNLTIDATSGSVAAGTVLTAGSFSSGSGSFAAKSVTAHGAVSIVGSTAIDGSLLGQGNVTIRGGNISAGTIVSGVDFAETKRSRSGTIVLSSDGALTLTATSGNVTAGTLLSAGDLAATASKIAASSITGRKAVRLTGELESNQVLGGGDITITGARMKANALASGVDFAATGAGNGAIALSDRGNLTINAASGSVEAGTILTAGNFSSRSGTLAVKSVTANGAVSIEGATAIDGSLLGQGNVTIRGGSISAGAIVSGVDFVATKLLASGNIVLGSDGALTLTATSGNVTAGTLLSAGNLAATASKVAVSNITGRKDIRLRGETETNQILGGRDVLFTGNRLKANSIASGVDFAATEAGNGSIALSDRGNLTIQAASGSVEAGNILTAGNLTSGSGTFAAKSATANGAVLIEGSTAIDGSLLAHGNVTIRGGSVSVGAIVSGIDFAATKRSVSGNIVLGSNGALTLAATSGNVTAGTLLSAGDLAATAANDVSAQATSRRNLTIKAGRSIRLAGQALAGADMTLQADAVTVDTLVSGVDFVAADGSPGGTLSLKGQGKLTIEASSGEVTASNLVSAGHLDVAAASNVSYGSLQSFSSARLASTSGSISLDRTTRAVGDITLVARSVDLSGNRGRVATGRTLAITADNANFSDSSYTFGGLDLRLIGRANFTGASINAVRRSGGSGDVRIAATAVDANAATTLLAERDIALTLARLDNSGQIAAGRNLSVSAGNLSNGATGLIYAGSDIDLLVSGDVVNDQGAVMAGGNLAIAGASTDRNSTSLTNISGLIQAGSDVSIKTGRLVNKRVASPTWTRDVLVASDVKTGFELNPDVAGKPFAFLFGGASDGRELYPGIGPQFWSDYEPQLWSQATAADGGSYRAWTWISANGPKWVGEIGRWIRDRVPKDENGAPIFGSDNPSRYFIVQYVNPGADTSTTYSWDFAANISQTIHEDRIVDAGGPQAMIRAGRNLNVTATNLTNSYSAIEADGNATLKGMTFSNEGLALNRTVQTTCNARGACEAYDADGNRDPSRDIAAGTSIISKVETTGVEAGTVKAGGHLDITGFATVSNTGAANSIAGAARLAPTTKPGDPLAALAGLTSGGALFTPNAALLGVAQGGGLSAGRGPSATIGIIAAATGPSATTTTLTAGRGLAAPTTILTGERPTIAVGSALSANTSSISADSGISVTSEHVSVGGIPTAGDGRIINAPAIVVDGGPTNGGGLARTVGTAVVAAVPPNTPSVAAPVADTTAGSLREAPRIDVERLADLAKPESGGFGGTIPGQVFLFETRAAFLDVGKFYGSGYYAKRVGYKPDTQVPFLGDAYFENQLIDRQIRQQTGYGLGGTFAPGKDAIEEMKLLLDNGIEYAKANKLSIGERLSPEQIARLTQSIVLYEKQVVQGIEVLAPVVYLANADKAKLTAAGALIAGGSVSMDIGKLDNSGAIAARTDLSIKAADIKVNGGSFVAGGDVKLASTGDLTFTAQSLDIGGMNVVNPNAAIVAGGNAALLANDGLKLQGATIDAAGAVALSANTITLDALKVDNGGSQNATGSLVKAGGNLTIAGNTDVSIIGSGAKAGKDLLITSQGSVNVVSTDVTRKVGDGYMTTTEKKQQDGQLVSGGSTTVFAGNDILVSGSSIRSGADVTLKATDDINITAAQETTSERFGKSHVLAERHQSSEVKAAGSITASAGEGNDDHDLNLVGAKLEAKERVDLKAADDLTIAEARDSKTADYAWSTGRDKTKSHEEAQTTVGSSVSGGAGVSTRSGGDTLVSASKLEAGTDDRKADLSVSAGGDLVVTSGKDAYEKHAQSEHKGFLSKTSASEDRVHETTVASELGASGNVTLNAGDNVAIAGSKLDAGQSVAIEGDNVAILGAEEKHADAEQKKKSGLFAGSGDGFFSLWGKEQKDSLKSSTDNVGSAITAGEDVAVKAREGDVAVIGSAIEAERDITLEAARDVDITPGAESFSSEEKEKRSGFGIAFSSGGGGASIGIGYGSKSDEVRQGTETNAVSHLSAGRDITVHAGRDANLQAAKVEAERDVAITAARDVNLLSARDRSNYEEVHEQLFAGVTLSVSTGLISAAESVGNAAKKIGDISDGYSAANAAFAGLKAYDALDNIVNGNVVSASLTVGFNYSKDKFASEASVPVTTDIRAGQSVTIEAVSGDLTGRGTQIAAGYDADGLPVPSDSDKAGDITLSAGRDIRLENAEASNSSSSSSKSTNAGIGIGGGIGLNGAGIGLTGNVGASTGKSKADGTVAVNSHVTGSGDVTLESGNGTTLKGAVVSGDTVKADVGGDLAIVSAPDTGKSSNSSASGGFSLGGALGSSPSVSGVQIGGGKGAGTTNWITEQSGLVSDGKMDVTVGGNTHLGAGKIVSDSGDLKLSTETLTHENFAGAKQYEGFNANVGIDLTGGKGTSANPVGNSTLEGNYKLDDTRQEVKATVGPGEIEVRNEEKQAALEQDGTSTLPLDDLNRDPDQAYQITRDKHGDLEFYVSSRSLQGVKDLVEKATDYVDRLVENGTLTENSAREVKEIVSRLEEVDPDSLSVCTGADRGSLWDLFITPAYASSGCVIRFKGVAAGKELSAAEFETTRKAIVAAAETEIRSNLKTIQGLKAIVVGGGTLSASQQQALYVAQGRLQEQMAHYALCSDTAFDLRNSGIVPRTAEYEPFFKTAEAYRLGGDAIASQFPNLQKTSQERLNAMRKENPTQYLALYDLTYRGGAATLDAAFLLNGLSQQKGLSTVQRAQIIESAAGNLAKSLFQTGINGINGIGGGNANGIKAAITVASANLGLDNRIALINALNVYAENHAKDVGSTVERARITTALVLAAGPIAEVSPAVAACMANLVCRNEAVIAVAEMMAGDALGGGTVAVGAGVLASKQVVNALEEAASGSRAGAQLESYVAKTKFWTSSEFQGTRVYKRNDLIDATLVDARGRTNLERMESGLAPIGPDGKSINLHHIAQQAHGALAELTTTFHQTYSSVLHINPNTVPSGIDRKAFDAFRRNYWINRAKDFSP